jgi:hypothetical protein
LAIQSPPRLFATSFLGLIPAAYAWQVHGFASGAVVYLFVCLLIIALGWTFALRDWSFRWLIVARVTLILLSMVAIGISAMEICESPTLTCH